MQDCWMKVLRRSRFYLVKYRNHVSALDTYHLQKERGVLCFTPKRHVTYVICLLATTFLWLFHINPTARLPSCLTQMATTVQPAASLQLAFLHPGNKRGHLPSRRHRQVTLTTDTRGQQFKVWLGFVELLKRLDRQQICLGSFWHPRFDWIG